MDEKRLLELLCQVREGAIDTSQALEQLRAMPFEDVSGFAKLDHHRALRCGFPEVVFGQGKSAEQLMQIIQRLREQSDRILVTRLEPATYDQIKHSVPGGLYHPVARLLAIGAVPEEEQVPGVMVMTAGTIDIPVAEEAALTAEMMGNRVVRLYDVGVAGLHRLLSHLEAIQKARVIVVVAGMEGALPSVVAGLVSVPVIAVPTSAGYGASFQGLAALLTMLNSCATGVAVVNIDNGFGAGCLASKINALGSRLC